MLMMRQHRFRLDVTGRFGVPTFETVSRIHRETAKVTLDGACWQIGPEDE